MARKQNLKFLLKEELSRMKENGYGQKKHLDKQVTRLERERLKNQGVPYSEYMKVDFSKDRIYCTNTFKTYCSYCNYFCDWLYETKGLKKISIEEAKDYIQEYIDYISYEKNMSAWSVNLALSAICKATKAYASDYHHPKRSIADIKNGKKEPLTFNDPNKMAIINANRLLGLRRSELMRLKAKDIEETEINGNIIVVVHTVGKGKKLNKQIFYLPHEREQVLRLKDGKADNDFIFDKKDFSKKANYHKQRALRARDLYSYITNDIESNPERKEFYISELKRIFGEAGREIREDLEVPIYVRGKNRERLLNEGRPIVYNRLAVLFVSVTVLSHFRSNVSVSHYIAK